METPDRDLTVTEAARHFGTHPETIRRWLRKGLFPHAYQISNRYGWRIPTRDLQGLKLRSQEHIYDPRST